MSNQDIVNEVADTLRGTKASGILTITNKTRNQYEATVTFTDSPTSIYSSTLVPCHVVQHSAMVAPLLNNRAFKLRLRYTNDDGSTWHQKLLGPITLGRPPYTYNLTDQKLIKILD